MFNIEVSDNINKVIQTIDAKKDKVELAVVRALNKTALWVKAQASREISTEKQIKLKLIRNRLQVIKANRNSLRALIRANLYGIKASRLGGMRQARIGAKVGKYIFPGAFIATMPRGDTSIFKRKGRAALPIQEVTLPLTEASKIIKELVDNQVERVFEKYFGHELNFILKKL